VLVNYGGFISEESLYFISLVLGKIQKHAVVFGPVSDAGFNDF
jgi:hypothetical protein